MEFESHLRCLCNLKCSSIILKKVCLIKIEWLLTHAHLAVPSLQLVLPLLYHWAAEQQFCIDAWFRQNQGEIEGTKTEKDHLLTLNNLHSEEEKREEEGKKDKRWLKKLYRKDRKIEKPVQGEFRRNWSRKSVWRLKGKTISAYAGNRTWVHSLCRQALYDYATTNAQFTPLKEERFQQISSSTGTQQLKSFNSKMSTWSDAWNSSKRKHETWYKLLKWNTKTFALSLHSPNKLSFLLKGLIVWTYLLQNG